MIQTGSFLTFYETYPNSQDQCYYYKLAFFILVICHDLTLCRPSNTTQHTVGKVALASELCSPFFHLSVQCFACPTR